MMRALLPLMAATAMIDAPRYGQNEPKEHKPFVSKGMPIPRYKTEYEKQQTKEHRKKLKARRNAKKGIYPNKISYKKKKG